MCVKYLDDLWAPFPTNPFSVGFEMATVHSLLSFIGRTWEKGTRQVELGHWKITSCILPSYHTKDINFSRHIGRGRREEPEKLIPSSRSCKCSLTSLSTRSKKCIISSLVTKIEEDFLFFLIFREKNSLTKMMARKHSNASKKASLALLFYQVNHFSRRHIT